MLKSKKVILALILLLLCGFIYIFPPSLYFSSHINDAQCNTNSLQKIQVKIANAFDSSICVDYCSGYKGDACFKSFQHICSCGSCKWDGSCER